jgi:LysR family transcriptional activator of nhaA
MNYKHLQYFWVVASEGSIAKASERLHVTPQTISGQLSTLEERIGAELFAKQGRGLQLTETGRLVLQYAEEIFQLGRELNDVLRGSAVVGPSEFIVGAASALPKTIVFKILEPALKLEQDISLISREGPIDDLLADLAVHKLDLVLSDMALPTSLNVKAYNHLLGKSALSLFASKRLADELKQGFPGSLQGMPLLLPTRQYSIRQKIDQWLDEIAVTPFVAAQFDDSALIKSFGQAGIGAFFMPCSIEAEVCSNFQVEVVGRIEDVKQDFYAISAERKVRHPAVSAICDNARSEIFGLEQ